MRLAVILGPQILWYSVALLVGQKFTLMRRGSSAPEGSRRSLLAFIIRCIFFVHRWSSSGTANRGSGCIKYITVAISAISFCSYRVSQKMYLSKYLKDQLITKSVCVCHKKMITFLKASCSSRHQRHQRHQPDCWQAPSTSTKQQSSRGDVGGAFWVEEIQIQNISH